MAKYKWIRENGKNRNEHRKIIEEHLGRKLRTNEIVHHKDGNGLNNDLDNLELMSQKKHSSLHAKPEPKIKLTCFICKKKYETPLRYYKSKKKKGQKFMCSKRCVGLYAKQFIPHPKTEYCKKAVKEGLKKGMSGYEIEKEYGVTRKTVYKIKKELQSCSVEVKPKGTNHL